MDGEELRLNADAVAGLSELAADALGLPPRSPYGFDIRLSGSMGKPGASLTVRWLQPGRTVPARDVNRDGCWLEVGDHRYRIGSPIFQVLGDIDAAMARARDIAEDGGRAGLIAPGAGDTDNAVTVLAAPTSPDDYAARLYAAFRRADAQGVDVILAVPPPAEGIGVAVRDRLARAAAGR